MPQYYVEGLYTNKQGAKRKHKTGTYPQNSIEPYAKTIWANSPKEAIQIASGELAGGEWAEEPRVSLITEEQRMRSMGAPEFPGITGRHPKKPKR
ncbi:MAG TPA: hypothetical protein VLD65_03385 [Anaerolineales bacterium]|nr:hypothetical protein [Anaerolineales bacterium]